MGLNFRNSNVQWSYSGFNDFRRRLAKEIGIDLDSMAGYGGENPWSAFRDDIKPFLRHSDCEGTMRPAVLKRVAPRLVALVKDWDDGFDKSNALELAKDMLRLAARGKRLEFR